MGNAAQDAGDREPGASGEGWLVAVGSPAVAVAMVFRDVHWARSSVPHRVRADLQIEETGKNGGKIFVVCWQIGSRDAKIRFDLKWETV